MQNQTSVWFFCVKEPINLTKLKKETKSIFFNDNEDELLIQLFVKLV